MAGAKDLKISNVKGLLIFLVVFGHLLEIYKDNYHVLFTFIYAFHMPLFIFVSGYLAKRVRLSKIVNFILLYLIFQTFYSWLSYLTGDSSALEFMYGGPRFHLWYIVSLIFWYIIAWLINHCRFRVAGKLTVLITICLVSFLSRWYTDTFVDWIHAFDGRFTSYTFSYQRTLTFMPFFFVGFFLNKQGIEKIYQHIKSTKRLIALSIVTILLAFLYIQFSYEAESIFRGSYGLDKIAGDDDGFLIYSVRIAVHYFIAFWMIYLLFNITTPTENTLTQWGDHSLTIFLFHPVVVFILRETHFMETWEPFTQIAFFVLLTIILSYILGSRIFVKATKYVCHPYDAFKVAYKWTIGNLHA